MVSSHSRDIPGWLLPTAVQSVGHRLRALVADLGDSDDGESVETGNEPAETTAGGDSEELEPTQVGSPSDLVVETGLTPDQYVLTVLDEGGGRLWQQDLIAYTGWSAPTMSRLLQKMEDSGKVVRICIGRQKLVHLPESAPESARSTPSGAVA